jgi:peptide/nickel transport system permease protein
MHKYLLRRLLYAIPTLLGVTIIIFLAMRVVPGDIMDIMVGEQGSKNISQADRDALEASLGLNKPLVQQYGEWLKDVGTLKLGESFWRGDSVMELIARRGPITLQIGIMAILLSWLIGIPVGILSALRQNSVWDYLARFFTILFLAIPSFWLGSLIVLAFLLNWGWKAPTGAIPIWEDPIKNLQIALGPSIVLGLAVAGYVARLTRSTLLEIIHEDYIRTARGKGLAERVVMLRHALRNALLPIITLTSVIFGFLIGGSVAVEVAFGVPGLGTTLVKAFNERDFIVIQNLVLLYGFAFVVINLVVDLTYAWLDPRIRLA